MIITDYCKDCGAKFQIDDAAISECEKKNKWECHCPGCNKYIDVKKYEFMFTENKNDDSANTLKEEKEKTVTVGKKLPRVFKTMYQMLWHFSLIVMCVGILFMIIDSIDAMDGIYDYYGIFTRFGNIAFCISAGLVVTAIPVYSTYWFMKKDER